MQANPKLVIALLAGVAVGALAVQGLHAQAKPTAYVISEIEVMNPEAYAKEYLPLALKANQDSGQKILAAGNKTIAIDGAPPKSRVVVSAYQSIEKAQAAYASPAYREARNIGDKYANFRIFAIEGVPPQ
jgi:uncharacterized protein (DUF1330 family)